MQIIKQSTKALNRTVSFLKKGGVIVCPTDTVYGFLADAQNKKAVNKIFKIKKRPKSKPLSIFVKDLKMAKEIAFINKEQEKTLKKHWPGKYTFVLKKNPGMKIYGTNGNTIAIRIPKYNFLNSLLLKINRPLVQTSVNISDKAPLNRIRDIAEKFKKGKSQINLIIDAGNLSKLKPSKIVDISKNKIKILRK